MFSIHAPVSPYPPWGNYRPARSDFKSGRRNPSEAKSPQNRRRHAHALNFVVELFGQGSACRLDLRARHLEPAKKRHEGTQAFRPAKKDSAHGILRAAHADRVLCPRGIGSLMIQPINVKRDRRRPGRRWRSVLGHDIGFLPPDRVAVPVRPHSRWARDLVLDFGGRDGLCADDTRLSRPPSRNDSPTRRKECPARKAISLATLESLQSQGKNYAARLEGRQGAELGIGPAYGELGAQKGRRATVTTGSVEA